MIKEFPMKTTSNPVFSVHEHELKPDINIEKYEQEVGLALSQLRVPGLLHAYLIKGFKGKRKEGYGVLWVWENQQAIHENFGTPEHPKWPSDWLHYENEVLAKYLIRHPDKIDFTTYITLYDKTFTDIQSVSVRKHSIISIDYQNDFCSPGGRFYKDRPCHTFINHELIPFLKRNHLKVAEIISDYRLPRPNEQESYCVPGTWGYYSSIDPSIKLGKTWIKSMNSPEWVRENGGDETKKPGVPYQDPEAFNNWLLSTIGRPDQAGEVILIGLTLDCCVLCTAQQLYFRGYKVKILKEASDIYSIESVSKLMAPKIDYKETFFKSTHMMWSQLIEWKELKSKLEGSLEEKTVYNEKSTSDSSHKEQYSLKSRL
jgi:nicotinamidase-related amidase